MGPEAYWFLLSGLSSSVMLAGAFGVYTERSPSSSSINLEIFLVYAAANGLVLLHEVLFYYAFCTGQRVPKRRAIGRHGKCAAEAMAVFAAFVLSRISRYSVPCLMALAGFTADLHCLGKILRAASDVSAWDVALGVGMQVSVYFTAENASASRAVLLVCGLVIWCKYVTYTTQTTAAVGASDQEENEYTEKLLTTSSKPSCVVALAGGTEELPC